YTPVSGTLNFNGDNGESFDIVVSITDDFVVELDESFELALPAINAGGRNITLAGGNGVGTIVNDDAAGLSIGNAIEFEDAGVLTFEVTLTGQVDEAFTVDFTTTDALLGILAQAGVDYVSLSDSLTFSGASGEVQTIQVTINPDNDIEGDEFFDVLLTAV